MSTASIPTIVVVLIHPTIFFYSLLLFLDGTFHNFPATRDFGHFFNYRSAILPFNRCDLDFCRRFRQHEQVILVVIVTVSNDVTVHGGLAINNGDRATTASGFRDLFVERVCDIRAYSCTEPHDRCCNGESSSLRKKEKNRKRASTQRGKSMRTTRPLRTIHNGFQLPRELTLSSLTTIGADFTSKEEQGEQHKDA
jgi:hypothetical protein